jgi:hypothetical protein
MEKKKKRLGTDPFDESPLGHLIRDTREGKKIPAKQQTSKTGRHENSKPAKQEAGKPVEQEDIIPGIQETSRNISEIGTKATFYIEHGMLKRIRVWAAENEKSISEVANEAFKEFFDKRK